MYTIYLTTTGQILRVVQTTDIELQLHGDEAYLAGAINDAENYIENGAAVAMPVKPNQHSEFDFATKTWIDQRTPTTQWREVRQKRNGLLLASDYTQLTDVMANKAAWATYRQALRDITAQQDPFSITWPTAPI